MPRTPKLQKTMGRLRENPELAAKVNWGQLLDENPDLDIDAIRRDFGQYLPEAPRDANVDWYLSHPLHRPRQLTATRFVGDKLSEAWNWYTGKLAEFGEINIPMGLPVSVFPGQAPSEGGRIMGNIALGAGKAVAGLPAFGAEVGHVAKPSFTGEFGESAERGKTLLQDFVDPAAKAAALITSRIESRDRPPTDIERQMYADVTGEEAFGVVAPALVAVGGPRLVAKGVKYVRGAGRQIISQNFQKMPRLEGVEGDFVRVGDKPATRKVYHKHPTEGWREYKTGKKASLELMDALDQYNKSVTPKNLQKMGVEVPKTPLLAGPPKREALPGTGIEAYGEGFTMTGGKATGARIMTKKGKRFIAKPYIRKGAKVMRPEEWVVFDLAEKEVSKPVAKRAPGRMLEGETPLGIDAELKRLQDVKNKIDEAFNAETGSFISDIMKDPEAGAIRLPSRTELGEAGRKVGGAAVRYGGPKRPSTILSRSEPGRRMIQRVIKAETIERTIRANAEIIMDDALKRKYPSGRLNVADRKWMRDNFKEGFCGCVGYCIGSSWSISGKGGCEGKGAPISYKTRCRYY
jgi:hypothetical protein